MDTEPTVPDAPEPATGATPATVPALVAVLVTHNPGDWFETTLHSFADQTYPDLGVLVVDTGSTEDPTDRVLAVLPDAHVHRLDHNPGYGAAANLVSELVHGASFYAFCHDDIALEPDSLRALVEEAFRSNAGVIGPKLVDWRDPRRLLQVGMSVDKTGVQAPLADRGELDQEQHDAVRDVFAVPGACTVVRTDLFEAIGGFDEGIDFLGDDVDLCWRTHMVGARVMIAPAARVRHLEALGERHDVDTRRRRFARHRLRTTLVSYGPLHRLRVIPQAFLFAVVEALYAMLAGHPDQARDVMTAWSWNLRHMGSMRARRRQIQAVRRVRDKEVRALQVRGSARLSAFTRGQFQDREGRVAGFTRSSRDIAGAVRDSSRQFAGTFAFVLAVILLISSRGLLFDGIPAIGELSLFPDSPRTLFDAWWSGWRPTGLGEAGPQPTGFGLLTVAGYVFFGATGVLRTVLILATIPIGAVGAWRLARPIGSARASVAAFAVYLALPVPYNAMARGSWSGLLVYAVSPWLLLAMGRATGIAPFGPVHADGAERSAAHARRRPAGIILGTGIMLGVAAAFVPFIIVIVAVMALAIAAGSLLCFRVAGVIRLLSISAAACVVAMALNAPWSIELITADSTWEGIAGLGSTTGGPLTLGHLLRFESGPWGAPPLGFAFLLAAVLPVVIGRSWRLEWAVRAWFVVIAGWGAIWASQEGHLPVGLPAAEVVLAPVAAALALTAALGLAAFETDLRAYRFGWRQVLSVAAALGVVLGAVPLGSGLIDGRWRTPNQSFVASYEVLFTDGAAEPGYRVLWLGDASLLPVAGWRYDDDVAYAATGNGVPTVLDRLPGPPPGATHLLADSVRTAEERRTNRLGQLLAPMGVRFVVMPERVAPSTQVGEVAIPRDLREAMAQQLDLREIPVRDGITIYENTAWASTRSVMPQRDGATSDYTDAIRHDLSEGTPVLTRREGAVGAGGEVTIEGDLLVSFTSDPDWDLTIDGVPVSRTTTYGWANQFSATRTGPAQLTYDTPLTRTLAGIGQVALWVVVIVVRRRVRLRERRADEVVTRTPEVTP